MFGMEKIIGMSYTFGEHMTFFAPVPLAILNKENTHENTHGLQPQLQLGAEAHSETTGCY